MSEARGKLALVTGGTRGIGLAISMVLSELGYQVASVGRSSESVSEGLEKLEGEGHFGLVWDMCDASGGKRIFADALKGRVPDVVVHAVGGTLGKASDVEVDAWREVFELNFFSAISINNWLLSHMEERGAGLVVHISSSAAEHGRASHPYGAAKAALNRYIVDTGRRVAKSGVVVTGIMPAAVKGLDNTWSKRAAFQPEHCEQVASGQVTGDFQTPEEIAAWVKYLCETGGRTFCGCVVNADGNV